MAFYTSTENKDTRSGFGAALLQLGRTNPNVVALFADLTGFRSRSSRSVQEEARDERRHQRIKANAESHLAVVAPYVRPVTADEPRQRVDGIGCHCSPNSARMTT